MKTILVCILLFSSVFVQEKEKQSEPRFERWSGIRIGAQFRSSLEQPRNPGIDGYAKTWFAIDRKTNIGLQITLPINSQARRIEFSIDRRLF